MITFDNVLKMIAICFRIQAGIPVLLCGETDTVIHLQNGISTTDVSIIQ